MSETARTVCSDPVSAEFVGGGEATDSKPEIREAAESDLTGEATTDDPEASLSAGIPRASAHTRSTATGDEPGTREPTSGEPETDGIGGTATATACAPTAGADGGPRIRETSSEPDSHGFATAVADAGTIGADGVDIGRVTPAATPVGARQRRVGSVREQVPALTRHRGPAVLAALLVAAQIGYPLTEGAARDRVTVAVVLLAAATALSHAAVTRGRRFAAGALVIVSGVGLLAEAVGTATGVPFGCYEYAVGRIGPELWSVPLIVPLAWVGGLYPVWVVAGMLSRRAVSWIGLTAIGAVGWDLFLDPQMVADGQWSWCVSESGLPGLAHIPMTNYLGWFAVGLVMAALLWWWDRVSASTTATAMTATARTWNDTTALPVAVFLWTWLGSILAHAAFLGLPASAGYGAVGMGLLGIPLLVRLRRTRALSPGR